MKPAISAKTQGIIGLPKELEEVLVRSGMPEAQGWWLSLDAVSRGQVLSLWEDCVAANEGQEIVAQVTAELEDEHDLNQTTFWHRELYEFLVNHEIEFTEKPKRTFHVCSQHPLAQAAVQAGRISGVFKCGKTIEQCPMQRMMNVTGGVSLRLNLNFRAKNLI